MIVLKDADIERAARGAVWTAFMNCGQSCASIERAYVARANDSEYGLTARIRQRDRAHPMALGQDFRLEAAVGGRSIRTEPGDRSVDIDGADGTDEKRMSKRRGMIQQRARNFNNCGREMRVDVDTRLASCAESPTAARPGLRHFHAAAVSRKQSSAGPERPSMSAESRQRDFY
jgi:hypothetical protein